MFNTGLRDLVVRPNAPWVHTIDFEGFDFTGAAFSAQFRDRKSGGHVRADLATVGSVGTEGITLTGVSTTNGVPTSSISIRLNEATTEGWIAAPSVEPEAGEDGLIYWQLQITPSGGVKFNALEGEVTVEAGAPKMADTLVRVAEGGSIVVVHGVDRVVPLVARAEAAATSAEADAASADGSEALAPLHFQNAGAYAAPVDDAVASLPAEATPPLQAVSRTALAAFTGMTAGCQALLSEVGREGVFVWSAANESARVTADPLQGVRVAPASDSTGASGAWVRVIENAEATPDMFGAAGNGVTNDAPALQAALNHSDVRKVVLGPKNYALNATITIPAGKSIIGSGVDVTRLKRLPYPTSGANPDAAVLRGADGAANITIQNLTIDANRAGQGGTASYRCHGIEMRGLNFRIRDAIVENTTGYATIINGGIAPCGGVIENVKVWNANVCYEQVFNTAAGITLIDCYANSQPRDGGAQVSFGCESFLHQYGQASNITVIRFYGEGNVAPGGGFNPGLLNNGTELDNITLIDCQFYMTGEGPPLLIGTNAASNDRVKRLRMFGCIFSSPNRATGAACAFNKAKDFLAVGCTFIGKNMAVYFDGATSGEMIGCTVVAATDNAAAGVYGVYADATSKTAMTGGSISATGGAANTAAGGPGSVAISQTTQLLPNQLRAGAKAGSGDTGGGVANGGVWNISPSGFDATNSAILIRAWGGGQNGANALAVTVGAITKTATGFSAPITNNGGNVQTLHFEWVAVPK